MRLAIFTCPLYLIDEGRTDGGGYGESVKGVVSGSLKKHKRYKMKVDRSLRLTGKLYDLFESDFGLETELIFGDKGVINANRQSPSHLRDVFYKNKIEYLKYISKNGSGMNVDVFRSIDVSGLLAQSGIGFGDLGKSGSDLVEDGVMFANGSVTFNVNSKVMSQIYDESSHNEGDARFEPYGFGLNYGMAGLALRSRGVDIVIGSDKPGSYLNYLYHTFMDPNDLMVLVPK